MGAERARTAGFGRLELGLRQASDWYLWGPYLSERQWGTVREDYSADGEAWSYLPHDHARSRAYRWGEDGLAGFCDVEQRLCLGLALWNGRDPILKERIFGLTGDEGNHGEDAKEYWWFLDALPSHAWNRWRYHYPRAAYPYERLIAENARRGRRDPEFELLDTGVFDDDRYWVVDVDYAKASPFDLLMTIRVTNVGPDADTLHVLPHLWYRNTWSWDGTAPHELVADGASRAHRPPVPRPAHAGRRPRPRRHPARDAVLPEGTVPIKVRSIASMIPMLAGGVVNGERLDGTLSVTKRFGRFLRRHGLDEPARLADAGLLRGSGDSRRLFAERGRGRPRRADARRAARPGRVPQPARAAVALGPPSRPPGRAAVRRPVRERRLTSPPSRRPRCSAATPTGAGRCGSR